MRSVSTLSENAPQRVGKGFGNNDVAEAADERFIGAREVDDPVIFGTTLQLPRVFPGMTGHKHALAGIDHIGGNRLGLLADPVLEDGESMFFAGSGVSSGRFAAGVPGRGL